MRDYIRLFWTGGWDSTYRLLDILLIRKKPVKPYYIFDEDRKSTVFELQAMQIVKEKIIEKDSSVKNLLLPTQFYYLSELLENKRITHMFQDLKEKAYIGTQYEWLARCASQYNLNGIELCVHVDDKAHYFLVDNVELVDNDFYILAKNNTDPGLELFKYFKFPIFNLSKLEMEKISIGQGFFDLMELTWFCHKPIKGKPYGYCAPCRYTREEGLSRRIPAYSMIIKSRSYIEKVNNKIMGLIK